MGMNGFPLPPTAATVRQGVLAVTARGSVEMKIGRIRVHGGQGSRGKKNLIMPVKKRTFGYYRTIRRNSPKFNLYSLNSVSCRFSLEMLARGRR